jgi:hypothetical protein
MMMKRQWQVWIGSLTVMISSVFEPCSTFRFRFLSSAITFPFMDSFGSHGAYSQLSHVFDFVSANWYQDRVGGSTTAQMIESDLSQPTPLFLGYSNTYNHLWG